MDVLLRAKEMARVCEQRAGRIEGLFYEDRSALIRAATLRIAAGGSI
jgi:hypothetical protein